MLGHIESVHTLLEYSEGAQTLNKTAARRRTPLAESVWHLHVDVVQALLSHRSIDVTLSGDDGSTALHAAAYWGKGRAGSNGDSVRSTTILGLLIQHHVSKALSLDRGDCDGCTALCYAAAADDDQDQWVTQLLVAKANPDVKPVGGSKALGWHAVRGSSGAFGAQPWGGSPLEEAASRGNSRVVATLLAAMAGQLDVSGASERFASEAADVIIFANWYGHDQISSPLGNVYKRTRVDTLGPVFAEQLAATAPKLQPPLLLPTKGGGHPAVSPNLSPFSPESPFMPSDQLPDPTVLTLPPAFVPF